MISHHWPFSPLHVQAGASAFTFRAFYWVGLISGMIKTAEIILGALS